MMRTFSAALYFAIAFLLAVHCYRNSVLDIDLLSYAGNIALADTHDPVRVHEMVYGQPLTPHLRGTDTDNTEAKVLRRRAADAYYSALYLPYFSVKPLYVLAMQAVHKTGANVVDANRAISAVCYFGIAVVLWLYTRSLLSLLILVFPESMILGQANEPDAMSVMLLLLGLWAVFVKKRDFGIPLLIISVWVRPENAILCCIVLTFLLFSGRLDWKSTAALLALTVASVGLISHYGYGWRSLYYHTFLGGDPADTARFSRMDYVHALAKGFKDLLHSAVPVFTFLWLVCFTLYDNRAIRQVLVISAVYSGLRFLIFPSYEARYYGLFFLTTAAAAVCAISTRRTPVLAVNLERNKAA
jgi:hypothetical protein